MTATKSRLVKLGLPVVFIAIAVFTRVVTTDDGGCPETKRFTIEYKILDSAGYKGTDMYMKEGVTMQNFAMNRGNCTKPNIFTWKNLTDHSVEFQAEFLKQGESVVIKPNDNYSFPFADTGVYSYSINGTEDTITIN